MSNGSLEHQESPAPCNVLGSWYVFEHLLRLGVKCGSVGWQELRQISAWEAMMHRIQNLALEIELGRIHTEHVAYIQHVVVTSWHHKLVLVGPCLVCRAASHMT